MTRSERARRRPLRLKRILLENEITPLELAKNVDVGGGRFAPNSTMNEIINHNKFPGFINKQLIMSSAIDYLIVCGVDEDEANKAFELDDNTNYLDPLDVKKPARKAQEETIPDEELPENQMLSDAAKRQFKLMHSPFIDDVQNASDVYLSADQQYVKSAMYQTAKRGGFIAVVGESGAGKTTLRRDLLDRISKNETNIRVVHPCTIDKTKLTAAAICDAIIRDLDQTPRHTLEGKARQIQNLLAHSSRAGNSHVMIIEEAHDLTIPVIKYLKRFWELEDGFTKLIAIILVAQPELKLKLNESVHPEVREVARRCEIIELRPLNGNLEEYLTLKFKRVGLKLTDVFEKDAFDALRARMSIHRGNSRIPINMMYPLVVNNTVTKAMNMCAELGQPKVNAEIIKEL